MHSLNQCNIGIKIAAAFLLAATWFGCSEPNTPPPAVSHADTTGISSSGAILLQGNVVVIPPPSLMSHIFVQKEIPFESGVTSDANHPEQWTGEIKKALNLGVLGADLSYLINYGQSTSIPTYLSTIRRLTDDLGISHEIDIELLNQIEAGMDNPANMLGLQSVFFRNLESYLKSNNRNELSTLILLGGWVEAMYQLASPSDSLAVEPLDRLLAEQTYSAAGFRALAESIQTDDFTEVKSSFVNLCDALEKLDKEYSYKEPIHDRRQGITYLRSNSNVMCNDEQIQELRALILQTRNLILTP
jgi:hypothetical protein